MPPISIPCPTSARKRSLADKVLAGLKVFVVRWQQDRAARALSGLSDYMLKDMGISRGEIQPIARSSREYRADRGDGNTEA